LRVTVARKIDHAALGPMVRPRGTVASVPIRHLLAPNPGPFTLEGTNTYVVHDGRGTWVIDPGPDLPAHLDAVAAAIGETEAPWRGVVLTHDHADHGGGVRGLLERAGAAPVHAARGAVDVRLADGEAVGPFVVVATPGHAPDHLAYVLGEELFSGDSVLGRGSVFVWPTPGALSGYLAALARLRARPLTRIHPGHGPLVTDAHGKLDEYRAHRLARETALLAALADGRRSVDQLLDAAWSEVPGLLRPAAAVTLAAHLDKLEEEHRLPPGVERPAIPELDSPEV
jgi:glyoxylase-like metal-dependent hydrolase (beta-lactamase superfamily II)